VKLLSLVLLVEVELGENFVLYLYMYVIDNNVLNGDHPTTILLLLFFCL